MVAVDRRQVFGGMFATAGVLAGPAVPAEPTITSVEIDARSAHEVVRVSAPVSATGCIFRHTRFSFSLGAVEAG